VFVSIYNESSHETNPLDEDGTGVVDITGSDGQEDVVIQSAHAPNMVFGKSVSKSGVSHGPMDQCFTWLCCIRGMLRDRLELVFQAASKSFPPAANIRNICMVRGLPE